MLGPAPESSSIQVFLSSTFVDMTEERRFVVERTLPELSRRCSELGLELREIDLRWGITAAEIQAGALLELCLEAIEKSSLFLAIIGYRYGTTIDTFTPYLLARWPWLERCHGKSITEIEIEYAALREGNRNKPTRVYCKARRGGADDPNVARLIGRLEQNGLMLREYDDAEHLGRLVHADVWNLVALQEGVGSPHEGRNLPVPGVGPQTSGSVSQRRGVASKGPFSSTALQHLAIQRWSEPTLSSNSLIDVLRQAKQGETERIAVFCDDPGERATLFADLLRVGALEAEFGCVIAHLCCASPVQSNPNVIVNNLIADLYDKGVMIFRPRGAAPIDQSIAKHLSNIDEKPGFYEGVGHFAEKLCSVLNAARDRNVTFVIDGLDEFPGLETDAFPFSTTNLALGVRIIIGIGTRVARRKAEQCGFKVVDLSTIRSSDVRPFIERFLARHSKKLPPLMMEAIERWPLASHLFSLKTLLNELRVVEGDAFLDQTVRKLTACSEPQDVVVRLLERVEASLDKFSRGYVRKICGALLVARTGVSEQYLTLVEHSGSDNEAAKGLWNSLRSALGRHLSEGLSGAFDLRPSMQFKFVFRLAGDYDRDAVLSHFSFTDQELEELHVRVASTLISSTDPENRSELAWHLWRAKRWERLERLVLSPRVVADLWKMDRAACGRYWSDLAVHSDPQIVEKFVAKLVDKREKLPAAVFDLVAEIGSVALANRLAETCAVMPDGPRPFSWAPIGLADQVAEGRDSFRAEEVRLKELVESIEKVRNPVALSEALLDASTHALKMAEFDNAMKGFDRIVVLVREEIRKPTVDTMYNTDDLLKILIECTRGQRDCLILQGKLEAARERSRLSEEMIEARERLKRS